MDKKRGEVSDLASVGKFSEDEVVEIVQARYEEGRIYTFAGPALVSLNPQRELGIYTKEHAARAQTAREYPHIYTIAERAWQGVKKNRDQTIILSGESGSGKTVNASHILEYLTRCAEDRGVSQKLMHAGPALEVFGNAWTCNNENSSRFGKYVEIFYQGEEMARARITAFLLEKGRAPLRHENFHVIKMLQMLQGAAGQTPAFRKMHSLLCCFYELGVGRAQVVLLFQALLAVMRLVEVKIEGGEEGASVSSVDGAAELLGVSPQTIEHLILTKEMTVGREKIQKKRTACEAQTIKDTLIRVIYERVFTQAVEAINAGLNTPDRAEDLMSYLSDPELEEFMKDISRPPISATQVVSGSGDRLAAEQKTRGWVKIGVLDIYGFEVMEENGLDQLCINYANEKIQEEYVKRVILENREAFKKEGIELEKLAHLSQAVSLFEGSLGLVKLLDEESFLPGGTAKNWLQKLSLVGAVKTRETTLEIEHYAGRVEYSAAGIIQKNRNRYADVYSVLNTSALGLLHTPDSHKGQMTRTGIIGEFQQSLHALLGEINQHALHYVRCINPQQLGAFSRTGVQKQLRFSGVFETIKIYMLGFFVKMTKEEFMAEYDTDPHDTEAQTGTTYVFLTEKVYHEMERQKQEKQHSAACIKKLLMTQALKAVVGSLAQKKQAQEQLRSEKEALERVRAEKEALEEAGQVPEKRDAETKEPSAAVSAQTIPLQPQTPRTPPATSPYTTSPSLDPQGSDESSGSIRPFRAQKTPRKEECGGCTALESKYTFQIAHIAECTKEIALLRAQLEQSQKVIEEKDLLVTELSHKIEVMLYELSSGEYHKLTTNPQNTLDGKPMAHSLQQVQVEHEVFKKICRIFTQNISPTHATYYRSVTCAFALFRTAAACKGGMSGNIKIATKAFESSALAALVVNKASAALSVGFFLSNAIFLARIYPGPLTSDMLQGVFNEGCKAIAAEVAALGAEFLFKPASPESSNILARLLNRPSIDSVTQHLKSVHSVLQGHHLPLAAVSSVFEHVARVIDATGFEYIIQRKGKFTPKHHTQLDRSLSTLTSLLFDLGVENPFSKFTFLRAFTQFVSMQKEGGVAGPVSLQLGILTSSQTLAVINTLSSDARGEQLNKLESALKGVGPPERIRLPLSFFTIPLDAPNDDPAKLHSALVVSPEYTQLVELFREYCISANWLNA
ncbi:myosin V [Nematocida displodere]|uniref:Myosin V n=1 Tax=Nematocida displodere TaxID=1805483 RepID=A0A177EAF6_9MICR|nr:myosin V [Nematocida displodere]